MAPARRPPARPGGPRRLPPRVYWTRRALVLATAVGLVVALTRLLGGTGSDPVADRASTASAPTQTRTTAPAAAAGPVEPPRRVLKAGQAAPSGECSDEDIRVIPSVPVARAGGDIVIDLQLLGTVPACTFDASAETLVVKVGDDDERAVWSSQDCRGSIPKTPVVVRSSVPSTVQVTWHGRASDDDCSTGTAWAMPGFYHVYAAALGSATTDITFEVTLPDRPVVTRTASPTPAPGAPGASASPGSRGNG